ncbi:MAG: DUF4349 domain-containing protein [Cyanobacteria bacterium P01_D01_bin.73]
MAKVLRRFSGVAIALTLAACGGGGIESGSAAPGVSNQELAVVAPEADLDAAAPAEPKSAEAPASNAPDKPSAPKARRRQLIKTANISVRVDSVDEAVNSLRGLAKKYNGDILSLNANENGDRPSANVQLSIPQNTLEAALEDAAQLGQVDNRNVSANDVTNQIVDADARLRNLRRTEQQYLKIMERAGAIKDVLAVTEQLNRTRQEIEQIDAQLKSLREQVAYSTLTINVQQKQAAIALDNPLGQQLGDSWQSATRSMGDLTVGLLKIILWLLAYTPYWLLLIGLGWGVQKLLKRQGNSGQESQGSS